jgi:DNA-binding LacI/PurR family transcriptional regulator
MRVTQRDIAKLAKVSQATVSRVLSGDLRVEQDIRSRVERVMSEQNYRPDVRARALRSRRAGLIGLVIKRPSGGISHDPFYSSLISSIVDQLSGTQFHLCVDLAANEYSHDSIYDEMLRSRRVDGVILVESEASDERIRRLHQDKFPFVLIGNPLHFEEVHSVDNDNVRSAELVTQHMVEQGFKRIGFLGAKRGVTVSDDRIIGYQRAIRGHQQDHLIFHSDFGIEAARKTAYEILSASDRPDALVVLDDFMALGVFNAKRELGLQSPRDLGLASFNDSPLCDIIAGGLTSVNLDIDNLVGTAVERLIDIIEDERDHAVRRQIIPSHLAIRQSSLRTGVQA